MPKVSVIIPTYNCARFLTEAIKSVLAQTYGDFEILVIDDGSTDNTKEVLGRYFNQYPDKIRYVYQFNQGLAVARNTGIKNSGGVYIALLDADDVWLPHHLSDGAKILDENPDVGLVHANITRVDENGKILGTPARDQRYLSGHIFEHIFLRRADVSCPTVLFRRECCDKVGLFDENLARLGCEDRELWLRMAKAYKFYYIDKVHALYRMRSGSMSDNQEKMIKARLYVVDKFCSAQGKEDRLRRLALARIYKDLGDEALCAQQFGKAKQEYQKALSCDPFSFWAWVNLLKTILGVKVNR